MAKISRRLFGRSALAVMLLGSSACAGLRGQHATTPAQGEGPYYPVDFPDDADNDLVHFAGGQAQGDWLHLSGRVLDVDGRPLGATLVEIWEADHRGIYNHPAEREVGRHSDPHYRGFGRTRTDAEGRFEFLTIVPAPYTGRPPHIHVKVKAPGRDTLTTQLYLKGHPANEDGWLTRLVFGDTNRLLIEPMPAGERDGRALRQAVFEFVV